MESQDTQVHEMTGQLGELDSSPIQAQIPVLPTPETNNTSGFALLPNLKPTSFNKIDSEENHRLESSDVIFESSTPVRNSTHRFLDAAQLSQNAFSCSPVPLYDNSKYLHSSPVSSKLLPAVGASDDDKVQTMEEMGPDCDTSIEWNTNQAQEGNVHPLYSLFPELDPDSYSRNVSETVEPSNYSMSTFHTDQETAHVQSNVSNLFDTDSEIHKDTTHHVSTQSHVLNQVENIYFNQPFHLNECVRSSGLNMDNFETMDPFEGFASRAQIDPGAALISNSRNFASHSQLAARVLRHQTNRSISTSSLAGFIMPCNENMRIAPGEMEFGTPAFQQPKAEHAQFDRSRTTKPDVESLEELKDIEKLSALHADATEEAETPKELNIELLPHQKRALCWMMKREKRNVGSEESSKTADSTNSSMDRACFGGCLLDDQGLGKTISIIALMYNSPPTDGKPWRTLIVCPLSLVVQWKRELENRPNPDSKKSIHVYHGKDKAHDLESLQKYDVVITTYGTVRMEYPKILKDHPNYNHCVENKLPKPTRKAGLLFSCTWERVVMDEAHNVRNSRTDAWKAVDRLKSKIRWCLTGTPIQNSVDDIYSLLRLIRYKIVNSNEEWKNRWKSRLESKNPETRRVSFEKFHTLLSVAMLRRSKNDKVKGKPILDLPARRTHILDKEFIYPEETMMYKKVSEQAVIEFRAVIGSGRIHENLSAMFTKLLRLRQACFHPYLIEYCTYRRKLRNLKQNRSNDTPKLSKEEKMYAIAMDDTQNSVSVKEISTEQDCSDGSDDEDFSLSDEEWIDDRTTDEIMREAEDARADSKSNELDDDVKEQSSRARKRLRVAIEDDESNSRQSNVCSVLDRSSSSLYDSSQLYKSGDSTEGNGILNQAKRETELDRPTSVKYGFESDEKLEKECRKVDAIEVENENYGVFENVEVKCESARKAKEMDCEGSSSSVQDKRHVRRISGLRSELKRKIREAMMQPSTKIKMILEKLEETRRNNSERKSLLFSQWTSCLDIVAYHLGNSGFRYCRLDGHMQMRERMKQIEEFEQPGVDVFLVSLRAGGEGLNLIMASQVFLVDAWWNPTLEEQAIDRVHRIGQKQDVDIYRFRMANTCEKIVYEIADRKRELISGAVGTGQSHARQQLSWKDLCNLFHGEEQNLINNK